MQTGLRQDTRSGLFMSESTGELMTYKLNQLLISQGESSTTVGASARQPCVNVSNQLGR
jgi:hypothetical protein